MTEEDMQRDDYTGANRRSWNEAADVHRRQTFERLAADFSAPGFSLLDEVESGILLRIGVQGKAVAQLCCNNGRELLSIKNLGAGECVGFDISDGFIEQARELAQAAGIDARFERTDVYAIPADYNARFDLIYITVGALGWLPDLPGFWAVARRLLKPGGRLFIYEMHPVLDMFEGFDEGDPPTPYHSYFKDTPYVDSDGLDYIGGTTYASSENYWFHHKLSDIIGGILKAGLALESFEEYGHDISNVFAHFANLKVKPPLSYTLIARAQATV